MQRLYFIALITFLTFGLFAQTTEELDKKNGFQNFKFNTPFSDYSKYNPQKVKDGHYNCTNIKDVSIGDFSLEKLELFFKDDKLVKVKITLDDQDRTKNERIFNALIKNYGRYTFHRSSSTFNFTSEMIWKGEFVNLVYSFTSFRDGDEFKTKIYLTYSHTGEVLEEDLAKDL